AAIGTSIAAKRAAAVHVIFNVLGTIIFMLALPIVYNVVLWLAHLGGEPVNIRMQIAYAHGLFNTTNTLIFLPLVGVLAYIVTKIVPGEIKELEFGPKYLDQRFLSNPSIALGQAQNEIIRMAELARDSLTDAVNFFFTKDEELGNLSQQKEKLIND